MDRDEIYEAVTEALEDGLSGMKDETVAEISEGLSEMVSEALAECLSALQFKLTDGTVITAKPRMKLKNSEGDKLLVCYGGLRVNKCTYNGGPEGYALWVQTRISSWDIAAFYQEKADAVAALEKVRAAMESGVEFFSL